MRVGIVGAGISGLYSAWRLAEAGHEVVVYEAERIGGRVDTEHDPDGRVAEVGAMRFVSSHQMLLALIEALDLHAEVFPRSKPIGLYLRGRALDPAILAPDFAGGAGEVPYRIREALEGQGPYGVFLFMLSELFKAAGIDPATIQDPRKLEEALSTARFRGRPFHAYGFWNVAEFLLSTEEYAFLRDSVGIESVLSNWNAHRALVLLSSLLSGLRSGPFHTLGGGMEQLIAGLVQKVDSVGVEIRRERVKRITHGDRVAVEAEGREIFDNVILALPRKAVAALEVHPKPIADRIGTICSWIGPVEATRIYLRYEKAWWTELGYAITTVPLRQIYYWDGTAGEGGPGLLMAGYTDADSAQFWDDSSARKLGSLKGTLKGPPVFESVGARGDDWLVEQVECMLEEVHGKPVPQPTDVAVIHWRTELERGCAWHAWRARVDASARMKEVREPAPGLHIVGEAWSNYQGWIEGALTSAEHVLRDHYRLKPFAKDAYLGP